MTEHLSDEVREHVEQRIADLMEAGMPEPEARFQAKRELGNAALVVQSSREVWGGMWLDHLGRDLRHGVRMLSRNAVFAAAAILCLGLGTGATTAIFSASMPCFSGRSRTPRRIAWCASSRNFPGSLQYFGIRLRPFLALAARVLRSQAGHPVLESFEGWVNGPANLAGSEEPVRATVSFVTGGMLQMLGVHPALGRLLSPEDDRPNVPANAVISYDLWQRAFGGDPAVLNRDVRLNGNACTVVGVMPRGFNFPPGEVNPSELWTPLQLDPARPGNRGSHYLSVLARLRPGVSLGEARAEMDRYVIHSSQTRTRISIRFSRDAHPIVLAGFQDEVVQSVRPAMLVLLGAVGFVLLIACVNVANLLLARSEGRRREIAVRAAVGASFGTLLRQFVAEGILLSVAGAGLGLLFALGGLRLLAATSAGNIPRAEEITMDWRVLLLRTRRGTFNRTHFRPGAYFTCAPDRFAWVLKSAAGRATSSAGANRFRSVLVISELALALVLLIGSGLMVKAFWKLQEMMHSSGLVPQEVLWE